MRRALFAAIASCALPGAFAADDSGTPVAEAPANPDYSFCTVCHGAQGNGNRAINAPKIAGIEPWYLKHQLMQFRAGTRGTKATDLSGMEMQPVGMQLDDASIEAVAALVATFKPKAPAVTVHGDAKRGRALYESCSGCHGARGEGNGALKAPALAGQTDWYLVTQLERFRAGERGFAPEDVQGSQMRAAAVVLLDSNAVNDVVAYINALTTRRGGT